MSRSGTSPARPGRTPRAGETVAEAVRRVFAPELAAAGDELSRRRLRTSWRRTLRLLFPLGRVSLGNRVEVFDDGDRLFEAMWRAIEEARSEVLLSTYILEEDRVGSRTLELLLDAARRGVSVSLVVDAFGSHRLGRETLAELRAAGARVLAYNPMLGARRRWPFSRLVRNHQKILIVDGRLGFAGGMNVAEEYAGERWGTGLFRDTHLCLEGPSVPHLADLVRGAFGEDLGPEEGVAGDSLDGYLVQILESNVRRHRRAIQSALRTTIRRAVRRCYLTSPYFVPPGGLKRVLIGAARRGVDVRVLTAGRSDVPLVRMASQHLYGRLLRAGVRVYELESRTLHAKTTTIDGVYGAVGSFNLDRWSDRRNLEVNVCVLDGAFAEELEVAFRRDLEGAPEVTLERWERRGPLLRLAQWVAYLLMRL